MVNTSPELAVIVPTYNEIDNVEELVRRLNDCLDGISWEAVFVDDDSPDGTAELVRRVGGTDARVRCVQRIGRRGLSSACVEGMLATNAPYLAVIDGDLQHDETLLPRMLDEIKSGPFDAVVGSRYIEGGGLGSWAKERETISKFATALSRSVVPAELKDPMSGFFMIRRGTLERTVRRLSGIGFKILVDIFASSKEPLKFKELPYKFRTRHAGESKLDSLVAWDYVLLLLDKMIGHIIPIRFISFSIVGGLGVGVHFAALSLMFQGLGTSFVVAQAAATLVAMTGNYVLNNMLTYRDMRLKGWAWVVGWFSFAIACGVGAIANVSVAFYLFEEVAAHWALAALAGVLIAAVWNYAITTVYTWRKPAKLAT